MSSLQLCDIFSPPAVPRDTAPIDTGSKKGAGAGAELTITNTAASINTRVRLCKNKRLHLENFNEMEGKVFSIYLYSHIVDMI